MNQLASHLPPEQIKILKQRRRTLKNREYAGKVKLFFSSHKRTFLKAACRNKRSNQREDLKNGCSLLNKKISLIDDQNEKLKDLLLKATQNFPNVRLPQFLEEIDSQMVVLDIVKEESWFKSYNYVQIFHFSFSPYFLLPYKIYKSNLHEKGVLLGLDFYRLGGLPHELKTVPIFIKKICPSTTLPQNTCPSAPSSSDFTRKQPAKHSFYWFYFQRYHEIKKHRTTCSPNAAATKKVTWAFKSDWTGWRTRLPTGLRGRQLFNRTMVRLNAEVPQGREGKLIWSNWTPLIMCF